MRFFKRLFTISVIFLIVVLIAGIIYVMQFQEEPSVIKEPKKETKQIELRKAVTPKKEKAKQLSLKPVPLRQVAIIIDDIGYDLKPVKELLKIKADLTFAILPLCPHTREAAKCFIGLIGKRSCICPWSLFLIHAKSRVKGLFLRI